MIAHTTSRRTSLAPEGSTRRVILGEVDPAQRHALADDLRQAGYDVLELNRGADVIDRVNFDVSEDGWCCTQDVVVVDAVLPDISGLEVLRYVHAHDWLAPVIMLSDDDDDALREEAQRLGATAVLSPTACGTDILTILGG